MNPHWLVYLKRIENEKKIISLLCEQRDSDVANDFSCQEQHLGPLSN